MDKINQNDNENFLPYLVDLVKLIKHNSINLREDTFLNLRQWMSSRKSPHARIPRNVR